MTTCRDVLKTFVGKVRLRGIEMTPAEHYDNLAIACIEGVICQLEASG